VVHARTKEHLAAMILSIHIPKTAGTSFRHYLQGVFGRRLLNDYGDWPSIRTEEALRHNEQRRLDMLTRIDAIRKEFDIIHGHYLLEKYMSVFTNPTLLTFVRDPYQHAISTYHHAKRSKAYHNPGVRQFHESQMTLREMIEASPNHQTLFLSGAAIEDFAMAGLTEAYERSIALFRVIFAVGSPASIERRNVNPSQNGKPYEVTDDVRRLVDKYRPEDVALYHRARERFEALARRYGV
jgi:hypothetical protein